MDIEWPNKSNNSGSVNKSDVRYVLKIRTKKNLCG